MFELTQNDLENAIFRGVGNLFRMEHKELSGLKFKNFNIHGFIYFCHFIVVDFQEAWLYNAFSHCIFNQVDFSNAKLSYTHFSCCEFYSCNFNGSFFNMVNFNDCQFDDTYFQEKDKENIKIKYRKANKKIFIKNEEDSK